MTSDAILAELRALPGAPDRLRERVRTLPEPQPRFAWTLPRLDVRRSLLLLAPAVVAVGVGAAALHGVLAGGPKTSPQPLALNAEQHGAHAAGGWSTATGTTPSFAPALKADHARAVALPPSA